LSPLRVIKDSLVLIVFALWRAGCGKSRPAKLPITNSKTTFVSLWGASLVDGMEPPRQELALQLPGRRRPATQTALGYTKAGGYTKHLPGYALWEWAMTIVTLSLRYARPRIGVGSEFLCAHSGRCPRDSSKRNSSAELEMDSRGLCVI